MSVENKIELLWNGVNCMKKNLQIHKLLKSYYINSCRKLAKNSLQIPKEKFAISQMCPYCGSFWNNSDYGLKLIPKQIKICSKTKKLIENLEQSKGFSNKILNKKQRNRAKWLKKKVSNHLAINCIQCKHSSLLKIDNSKLKQPKQSLSMKKTSDVRNASAKCSLHKPKNGSNANKNEECEIITPDQSKSHKKSKSKNNKPVKPHKQNSLLQLAALLQKQSKDSANNSAQKRLLSFLK